MLLCRYVAGVNQPLEVVLVVKLIFVVKSKGL